VNLIEVSSWYKDNKKSNYLFLNDIIKANNNCILNVDLVRLTFLMY